MPMGYLPPLWTNTEEKWIEGGGGEEVKEEGGGDAVIRMQNK